jgi:hypothetical protein
MALPPYLLAYSSFKVAGSSVVKRLVNSVAAIHSGRQFIGIERDATCHAIQRRGSNLFEIRIQISKWNNRKVDLDLGPEF